MPWFVWFLIGIGCAVIFLACCEQADRAHERWEKRELWNHPPDQEIEEENNNE